MALKFIGDDAGLRARLGAPSRRSTTRSRSACRSSTPRGAAADGRRTRPSCTTRSRPRGCSSWPRPGNDGVDNDTDPLPSLPAAFDLPNIVSVAAIDNTGGLAAFSNYGETTVDIAAPGEGILSSLPADSELPAAGLGLARRHVDGGTARERHRGPGRVGLPVAGRRSARAQGPPAVDRQARLGDERARPSPAGWSMRSGRSTRSDRWRRRRRASRSMSGRRWAAARIATRVAWPSATDDQSGVAGVRAAGAGRRRIVGDGRRVDRPRGARRGRSRSGRRTASATAPVTVPATGATFVAGPPITPLRYQETSSKVTFSASWRRYSTSSASGGHTRYATRRGASVTFRFTGRAVALIAPKGPTRGSAKLYVDGVYVSTISLYRSQFGATDRGRGTVVVELGRAHGQAGRGRDRAPPALRRRRLRDPALTRLSSRGRSSSRTARAAAGRGSSAACRSRAGPR